MNATARSKSETSKVAVSADLQKTIECLIESRPDLADSEQFRRFNEALRRRIAADHSRTAEIDKNDISWAKKITSIATAFSGGASAALVAALVAPGVPELAIVGIGLVGVLVSKYATSAIDGLK